MSRLADSIAKGKFVVTAEVGPPKGTDVAHLLEMAEILRDHVDAVNVTDQQSSVMTLGSLPVCHLLLQSEIEPIFQVGRRYKTVSRRSPPEEDSFLLVAPEGHAVGGL